MITLRCASGFGAVGRAQSQFGKMRWAMLRPASWTKWRLFNIGARFQVLGVRFQVRPTAVRLCSGF